MPDGEESAPGGKRFASRSGTLIGIASAIGNIQISRDAHLVARAIRSRLSSESLPKNVGSAGPSKMPIHNSGPSCVYPIGTRRE